MILVVKDIIDRPEHFAYVLKDGTIIKLSWNNPARVQGEKFSEGQVINFLPEDVITKSDVFKDTYKNIGESASKPYKVQTPEGDSDAKENDLVNSRTIVYQGIISKVITLPSYLDGSDSLIDVRCVIANENLYLDRVMPLLISQALKVD